MPVNIKHPQADCLARELAEEIMAIARRCAALPDRDTRTPDEIVGYDEQGCRASYRGTQTDALACSDSSVLLVSRSITVGSSPEYSSAMSRYRSLRPSAIG